MENILIDLEMNQNKRVSYNRNYYIKQLAIKQECQYCGCEIVKIKMKRHHTSQWCNKFRKVNEFFRNHFDSLKGIDMITFN